MCHWITSFPLLWASCRRAPPTGASAPNPIIIDFLNLLPLCDESSFTVEQSIWKASHVGAPSSGLNLPVANVRFGAGYSALPLRQRLTGFLYLGSSRLVGVRAIRQEFAKILMTQIAAPAELFGARRSI
jgi:hypothetical protein